MKKVIVANDFPNDIENIHPNAWHEVCLLFEQRSTDKLDFTLDQIKLYLNKIKELYPNSNNFKFAIEYKIRTNFIIDKEENIELIKINNYLYANYKNSLYISKHNTSIMFPFKELLISRRRLQVIANRIKNATITINNEKTPLSNFEKFMLAYEYVTNYVYNKGGDYHHLVNSNWVTVIGKDKIICTGYSSLLRALCDLIFPNEEVKVFEQKLSVYPKGSKERKERHSNNIAFIKDDKYNIDGLYYVDSCWDCLNDKSSIKPLSYCCIPLQDLLHSKVYDFVFDNGLTNTYLLSSDEYVNNLNKSRNPSVEYNVTRLFPPYKNIDDISYYWLKRFNDYNLVANKDLNIFEKEYLHNYGFIKFKQYKIQYNDILKKYSKIKLPYFFSKTCGLYSEFEILEKSNDANKIREAIIKIGEFCLNNPQEIELISSSAKQCDIKKTSLINIICNTLAYKDEMQETTRIRKEKRKELDELKKANVNTFLSHLNTLADSKPIPIEAYLNSFMIIGKTHKYENNELKNYVKQRTLSSINRFKQNFDTTKCSCSLGKTVYRTIQRKTTRIN